MRAKLFTVAFALLFLVSLVSAAFTVLPTTLTFTSSDAQTFTIANNNIDPDVNLLDVTLNPTLTITGENSYPAIFNIDGITAAIGSTASTITLDPAAIDFSKFELGESYSADLIVTDDGDASTQTITVRIENNDYCDVGEQGTDLSIDVDIENVEGFGKDDEWYMFDEIEVEITVENDGDVDLDDIVVEWGLYNTRTGNFVIDEEEKDFNLDENEEEKIKISFMVDPDDFDEDDNANDFIFVAKAYSDDLGEENLCVSYTEEEIKVMRDDHFVIIGNIEIPDTVQCGETYEVTAEVWNIGDNDEEDVSIQVGNKDLGLDQLIEVGDLDIFDKEKISFILEIPQDSEETFFKIEFKAYDEDNDIFENEDNDEAIFSKQVTLNKDSCTIPSSVTITAAIDSEAIAGQEMVIKTTLTNTGDSETSYKLLVANYDSWATLESVTPKTLNIAAGQSQEVTITLLPNEDVEGQREFTVQTVYNGKVEEQRVSVTLEPSKGLSGITGSVIGGQFKENWVIWIIGLVNVILIVLIIVVAVRVARK